MATDSYIKESQVTGSKSAATVGRWHLLKKIGSGYTSKVKLGYDPLTRERAAVKIIPLDSPKLNPRHLAAESYALKTLKHPHVIKLIEYLDEVDYCKKNGTTYKVVAFVLELAPHGSLFKLITGTRMEEWIIRKIFQQLLETIEYCHSQKFAHRDLKPENILLDKNYNLKIADFGFSISLMTENGKEGCCDSFLGTEGYMAPELLKKVPYCPAQADLYALAIILFMMYSGTPPFLRAHEDDTFFKFFMKKPELFWKAHEKNKPKIEGKNFFSEEFKTLMNAMLALDRTKRLNIPEIKASIWYQGSAAASSDLQQEIRKLVGDAGKANEYDRIAEKEEVKCESVQDKAEEAQSLSKDIQSERDIVIKTTHFGGKREEELDQADAEDSIKISENLLEKTSHVRVMS